ncbi:MAG: hypothetical protein IKC64_01010 [Clostridia bacterium]|nr:hypothetical protein [Clostridia bacterium]
MKKNLTRTVIIIVASVIIALGVTALVLSLVEQTPLKSITSGYSRVDVYDLNNAIQPEMNDDEKSTFKNALGKTSYSVMQGILEGKAGAELTFKDDSNGDKLVTDGTTNAVENVTVTGAYKVEFYFDDLRTVTVEGETIEYNRIIVFVYDTVNEIKPLDVYFYDYNKVGLQGSEEEYDIYTVQVRAKTTDLFNAITEIIA